MTNKRGTGPLVTKLYTSAERKAEYWKRKTAPKTRLLRPAKEDLLTNLRRRIPAK